MEGRLVISIPRATYAYKRNPQTKEPVGGPMLRFTVAWGFVGGKIIDEGKKYIMRMEGCIGTFDKNGTFNWGAALNKFGWRHKQLNTMTNDLHDAVVDALERVGILQAYRERYAAAGPPAFDPRTKTVDEPELVDPVTVGNYIIE